MKKLFLVMLLALGLVVGNAGVSPEDHGGFTMNQEDHGAWT